MGTQHRALARLSRPQAVSLWRAPSIALELQDCGKWEVPKHQGREGPDPGSERVWDLEHQQMGEPSQVGKTCLMHVRVFLKTSNAEM